MPAPPPGTSPRTRSWGADSQPPTKREHRVTTVRPDSLVQRRRILLTMLAAARFPYEGSPPELVRLLRGWLDSWIGIGRIAGGMARQGYDLQLTRYGEEGWRATFY